MLQRGTNHRGCGALRRCNWSLTGYIFDIQILLIYMLILAIFNKVEIQLSFYRH
jgi:hypothetical protein